MTGKEFMAAVANGKLDILQLLLNILQTTRSHYCVIDGLAVNAYVEPVVSLDLDVVVIARDVEKICGIASEKGLKIERYEHSIYLSSSESDFRIQLQIDPRFRVCFKSQPQKRPWIHNECGLAGGRPKRESAGLFGWSKAKKQTTEGSGRYCSFS